jgi:hypothetical protein
MAARDKCGESEAASWMIEVLWKKEKPFLTIIGL